MRSSTGRIKVGWLWVALALLFGVSSPPAAAQQTGTVRGRVVAAGNLRPLVGAQVSIPNTGRGSLTNAQGEFLIVNVPTGNQAVRVQMIGYGAQEQTVTVAAGQAATTEFRLAEEALALDEVVVTGTAGTARRREIGNSISQIDLSDVAEPVLGVDALLQSRAPGVNVSFADASVGAGAVIRLRGNVSVSQGNQPLIYIDGVRQTSDAYPRGNNQKQGGPLGDINPNDIARVEIIKGAAAATLFGTEAAAGVIQIFTKKGASGEPTWTYQTDQSLSWVQPFGSDQRPLVGMEPWLRNAHGQRHNLSLTGGIDRLRYFVSGSLDDRDGVLLDDEENRRSIRTNLSFQATEDLGIELSSAFTNHGFVATPNGNALESIFFNVYRAPNNFVRSDKKEDIDRLRDRELEQTNERVILGLTGNWNPAEEISSRVTLGYDRAAMDQYMVEPFGYVITPQGRIEAVEWRSETVTLDAVGSYHLSFSPAFRTTLSAGGQLVRTEESYLEATGRGLPGPGLHTLSSTAQRFVEEFGEKVNTGGFFVQSLFNVLDRYFITAGLRVDGNSAFGEDFGLQPYPKLSASYVISDEPFWPDAIGQMKLRAAYGFAGRAPGAFDAVRTWSANSFAGQTAFLPDNLGNPNLGPERTGELEVGFDGSFLDDRLTADFTYYHQRTSDALLYVSRSPTLGFTGSQLENVGELENQGVELAVNYAVIRNPAVTWEIGGTASTNRNEILDMGGIVNYTLVEGQPAGVRRGAKVTNPNAFEDPDYEIDAFFGPPAPTRTFGINTTLQLPRGLMITARGEYQGGHYLTDFSSRLIAQRGPIGPVGCDEVYQVIPWSEYKGPGDTHPKLDQVRALDRALCYRRARSDAWTMPADFFKLREITAQIPSPVNIPGTGSTSLTASVRNLWRWTNSDFYSFDPEVVGSRDQIASLASSTTDQIPPPASVTLSVRITF